MTALLVLKPGVTDTVNRAVARVLCMLAGAILVSFCIAHLNPAPVVLASFTLLFAWLSYGTVNVNYAPLSGLYHRIHRLPVLTRSCSGTCDCATPSLMQPHWEARLLP
jgi:hypothetical protein